MHSELDFRSVQIITGHVIYNSPYKYWPDENDPYHPLCWCLELQIVFGRRYLYKINKKMFIKRVLIVQKVQIHSLGIGCWILWATQNTLYKVNLFRVFLPYVWIYGVAKRTWPKTNIRNANLYPWTTASEQSCSIKIMKIFKTLLIRISQ